MIAASLYYPMVAHIALTTLLYGALTIVRAPAVWGVGAAADGSNPFADVERRVSANLSNQFEWPGLLYVACLLALMQPEPPAPVFVWLAWVFIAGRIAHSGVQIFTTSTRLRGLVFTVNFLAVIGMWGWLGLSVPEA